MLTVDEALAEVLLHAQARPPTKVAIGSALGLVLAEDVTSDVDSPPHDKSIVDGYAVATESQEDGRDEFEVIEEIVAGCVPRRALTAGQAARIMTGAPVPRGTTAVVMVERTEFFSGGAGALGRIKLVDPRISLGQNIMRRAASMSRGATVLSRGSEIRPIEVGLLAEVGRAEVLAVPKPTVAILPTGNELVSNLETPQAGQIRNSNGPMLLAAAQRAGALALELPIGRDSEESLRDLVLQGLASDIVVISGGVSAGVLDLVPKVLSECGVRQVFHKISLKPGKPLWFGILGDNPAAAKLVFGLPGNPVSSLVCFELFVRSAIGRLSGRKDVTLRPTLARLSTEYVQRGDRPTYHPARLERQETEFVVSPLPWRGSGDLAALSRANALAHFPAGGKTFQAGEWVEAYPL